MVEAVNKKGKSPSRIGNDAILPSVPEAPTSPVALSTSATSIQVEWSMRGDGGSPIIACYLYYKDTNVFNAVE
jgi:hypothetical protein